jgi:hypothetical protein
MSDAASISWYSPAGSLFIKALLPSLVRTENVVRSVALPEEWRPSIAIVLWTVERPKRVMSIAKFISSPSGKSLNEPSSSMHIRTNVA